MELWGRAAPGRSTVLVLACLLFALSLGECGVSPNLGSETRDAFAPSLQVADTWVSYKVYVRDTGSGASVTIFVVNQTDGTPFLYANLVAEVSPTNATFAAAPSSSTAGAYVMTVYVSTLGDYSFKILSCGSDNICSPINDNVYMFNVAGAISASHSFASGYSDTYAAGEFASFNITAEDAHGIVVTEIYDPSPFSINISSHGAGLDSCLDYNVVSQGQGIYTVTFMPCRVLFYFVSVTLDEVPIYGGQFWFNTTLDAAAAARKFVLKTDSWDQSNNVTAGEHVYSLLSTDPDYQVINNFSIVVVPAQNLSNVLYVLACADSRSSVDCSFLLNITVAGRYSINVTLLDEPLQNMPYTLEVLPGIVVGQNSELAVRYARTTVGQSVSYHTVLRDVYGNFASSTFDNGPDSSHLTVGLYSSLPPIIGNISVMYDNAGYPIPGQYLATFNVTVAGNFTVVSYFGSSTSPSFPGSGFTLIVIPGEPSAEKSFISSMKNLTAGSISLMRMYLKDSYNNTVNLGGLSVTATVSNNFSNLPLEVAAVGQHFEAIISGIYKAADYQVIVSLNGSLFLGSNHFHVFGRPVSAANCSFIGLRGSKAGIRSSFVLQQADEYGNTVDSRIGTEENYLDIFSPNRNEYLDVSITQLSAGFYNVSYIATKAGKHMVIFSAGQQQLAGEFMVFPGSLDVRHSSFSGSGTVGGPVNTTLTVIITPRDSFGNRLLVNYDDNSILQVSGTVRPFGEVGSDGAVSDLFIFPVVLYPIANTYNFGYRSVVSGNVMLEIAAQGVEHVIESVLTSRRLSIHNTYLAGMGMNGTPNNRWASFFIKAYDVFGNVKNDPGSFGEPFRVAICSQIGSCSTRHIYVTDTHHMDGQYVVNYFSPVSGNYTIYISWNGKDVSGSPLVVPVVDDHISRTLDPSQFVVCLGIQTSDFCPGLFGTSVGQKENFTVTAADSQGIPLLTGGALLVLTVLPSVAFNASVEDQGTGDYIIHYATYVAGNYTLTLAYNGIAFFIQQLEIVQGVTSASKSTLLTPLPSSFPIGVTYSSAVNSLDEFMNQQVYGPRYPYSRDQFLVLAVKSTGEKVHGYVSMAENGSFIVSLNVYLAGTYNVSVLLNGDAIADANKIVVFEPGPPAKSATLFRFRNVTAADDLGVIQIFPLDAFGNELTLGLNCSATITNSLGGIFAPPYCNLSDYPIELTYNLTGTGQYSITMNLYDFSGVGFQSMINVTVKSGQPAAQNSGTVVDGVLTTTTGATSTVFIDCKDIWGNACMDDFSGLFTVSLWIQGFPPVFAQVSFNHSQLVGTFVLYKAGNYTGEVQVDGVTVARSPFVVMALPAPSSAVHSYALYQPNSFGRLDSSLEEATIVAGSVGLLKVVIIDIYGNRQDSSVVDVLNVSFTPVPGLPPEISTGAKVINSRNADGTFAVTFSANRANYLQGNSYLRIRYLLSVGLLGQDGLYHEIAGSPFKFFVEPGPVNVAESSLEQTESWAEAHGLMWMVTLTSKDAFGNAGPFDPMISVMANLAYSSDAGSPQPTLLSDEDWFASPGYEEFLELEQFLHGEDFATNHTDPPIILNNHNGTFFVYFTAVKSGLYNVSVFINNALVGGPWVSITNYQVMPGPVDRLRLIPTGLGLGYKATVAGQLSAILLQSADKFGNLVTLSEVDATSLVMNLTADFNVRVVTGASFIDFSDEIAVAKKNISVDDDGLVWLFYQPLKSGQLILTLGFTDSVTSVTTKVLGSPFYGTVEPGTILSSNCDAFGPGLRSALACNSFVCPNSSIYLEARDSYNNLVSSDTSPSICQSFTVIAGPSITFDTPVPYNGRCLLTYKASKVSTQNVAIQYLWSPIQSSPFGVVVRPTLGDASPRKCLAWGDLGGSVVAGTAASIRVQLVDSNGIELFESPSGTANFVNLVLINSTIGVAPPNLVSRNNFDGTFTLKLMAFSSGFYAFNILVGPMRLPLGGNSDGYVLRFVSGPTVIAKTTATLVSNSTLYRAGKDLIEIELQAMDKFDNLQDYVMASSDFFEAHIFQPDGLSVFVPLALRGAITDDGVPYEKWVLSFSALQSPVEGSMYTFEFLWSDGYLRENVLTSISLPVYPGAPFLDHTRLIGEGALTAVAGLQATFAVQLYDKYHNPIRSESDVLDSNVTVVVSSSIFSMMANCSIVASPFALVCNYVLAETGNYTFEVLFNGINSKVFPNLTVNPAPVYAPYCMAWGEGVGEGDPIYAGTPVRFVIDPVDIFRNPVLTGGDLFSVVVNIMSSTIDSFVRPMHIYPRWTGTNYEVYYTPERAGDGEVQIRMGSVSIQDSPYLIHVNPGPVSAEHSLIRSSAFGSCMAGDMHSITLVSMDKYGNSRPTENDIFAISKYVEYAPDESDITTLTHLGNGVYQYVYRCQHAGSPGQPNCTSISISFGEDMVLSTQFTVIPGPVDISKCMAILSGSVLGAGSAGSLLVVSKDSFDNQLWAGGLDCKAFLIFGDTNSSITGMDNEDGTYLFKYRVIMSGNHTVQARIRGQLFFTGYIQVIAGPADVRHTRVTFNPMGYVSGAMGTFWVQLFDKFSNNVTYDELEPSLLMLSLTSFASPYMTSYLDANVSFTGVGYDITFTPRHPGLVQLGLNISNKMLLEVDNLSPFSALVASGPPSIFKFAVFGPGIDAGGIVNQAAVFFVHVKDEDGNRVSSQPTGTWVVTFSPTNIVTIRPQPFFLENGTVLFTYIPVYPVNDLAITVLYGGQSVGPTRYVKVKLQPGFWSLKHCAALDLFHVPLDRAVPVIGRVGTNLTILLQIRDKDGMNIPSPDPTIISFLATVSGVPVDVGPTPSGLFGFMITETVSRKYVVEISSPDGLQLIKNSGFIVVMLPGLSEPQNTMILTSDGMSEFNLSKPLIAGDKTVILLQAQDQYYNQQIFSPLVTSDIFSASLSFLPSNDLFNSYLEVYNVRGRHMLHVTPDLAGNYWLTVFLNGVLARNMSLCVKPGAFDFSSFQILPLNFTSALAGVETGFELMGKDLYMNIITEEGAWSEIYVELQPLDGGIPVKARILPQDNSTAVLVSFMVLVQGSYNIVVSNATAKLTGNMKSTDWVSLRTINVWAGPIVPSSLVTALPSRSNTAGEIVKVFYTAFDRLMNVNYSIPWVTTIPSYDVEVASTCISDNSSLLKSCSPCSFSISFVPTKPGSVNVSLIWMETSVWSMLQIVPTRPPTLLSAKLSDNLAFITVLFDRRTDAGFQNGAISLSGSERCSNWLSGSVVEKLGTSPSCTFRDQRTLVISLGYNSSMLPADSESPDIVEIMDNAIFGVGDNSQAAAGYVLLMQPDSPMAPKARLEATNSISPCDTLFLDASDSSGGGGRPLRFYYSVEGTGNQNVVIAISQWLRDAPSSTMSIVLDANMLEAGQTYTFWVTVVNFIGVQSKSTATITTTHVPVPLLTIFRAEEIQFGTRGEFFEIEALASLPSMAVLDSNGSCSPMDSSIPMPSLAYEWSQTGGPLLGLNSFIWNTRVLTIDGKLLEVGYVYNFSVRCSLVGFPTSLSTAQVSLAVESSPLSVAIIGGNRTVNSSESFTLEVDTYDPDSSVDLYGQPYQFNYFWSCDPELGTNALSLNEISVGNVFGKKINIPSGYLTDGTYNFSVTVHKQPLRQGRVGVTAWVLVTASPDLLTVDAALENAALMVSGIPRSKQVRILCTKGLLDYSWSISSATDQRELLNATSWFSHHLMIPANTLLAETLYTVCCNASSSTGHYGGATLNMVTVTDPTGGDVILSANSESNIAGHTLYKLVAHGWTPGEGNGSVKYEFRYTLEDGEENVIQPLSFLNFVDNVAVKPGNVTFRIYITNPKSFRVFCGDAPQGAVYELPQIYVVQAASAPVGLPDGMYSSQVWTTLYNYFLGFRGQGRYFRALQAMEIFGSLYIPKGAHCSKDSLMVPVVSEMLDMIETSESLYPAPSTNYAVSPGSGPYTVVALACALEEILQAPGNVGGQSLSATVEILENKLQLVAAHQLSAASLSGRLYYPCFFDALDALVWAVHSSCNAAPQSLIKRASELPLWLALTVLNDNTFDPPTTVVRNSYYLAAATIDLQPDMASNLTWSAVNFQLSLSNWFGDGTVGAAIACFPTFAPLTSWEWQAANEYGNLVAILQTCDFALHGLPDSAIVPTVVSFSNVIPPMRNTTYAIAHLKEGSVDSPIFFSTTYDDGHVTAQISNTTASRVMLVEIFSGSRGLRAELHRSLFLIAGAILFCH